VKRRQSGRGGAFRHLNRSREIVTVFLKHGFSEVFTRRHIKQSNIKKIKDLSEAGAEKAAEYSHWARIRMVLEELGTTFIKFGQIMSNRPDLLPAELIVELEKLQTGVPPFPADEAIRMITEELGKAPDELFEEFDSIPVASASIAQAHRAVLKSGDEVIIKVQRPGIKDVIHTDIEIMMHLAGLIERLVLRSDVLDAVNVIREFGRSLDKELNFSNEAMNIRKFAENFKGNENLTVPAVYDEYSTSRVLTMEYVHGTHVLNLKEIEAKGVDMKRIANIGAELILEQVFEHGFFHADPHPGNVMVLDDGRICFLDFGMMGMILPQHRKHLSDIIIGIVNQDSHKLTRALIDFSRSESVPARERLEYEVFELVESYAHLPLKEINMGELIPKMLSIVFDYSLRLPPNIFMLSKALITIEGVGSRLDPDFNMMERVEPFARKLIMMRFSPKRLGKSAYSSASDILSLIEGLPEDTQEVVKVLKSGRLRLDFENTGLDPIFTQANRIVNRLAFSIIFASLIIGSALLLHARVPPLWNGLSLIGIAGFFSAAVMGFWLLASVVRNSRL
jgi:ubiquinone biosynthesis protein